MAAVEILGRIGPEGPGVLVLYTGGTIGMAPGPDGALVQVDLRELGEHMPFVHRLPIGLTVATFATPIDSSVMTPTDWVDIADAVVAHAPGHVGVVVLHGTDTMAYTASALSFLLDGIQVPIILTGAQRPVTELRSDGRENLVASLAIASGHHLQEAPLVPEVTIFFDEVLLRGNRAVKVHADSYRGFDSPNLPPLATAGTVITFDEGLVRPAGDRTAAAVGRRVPAGRLAPPPPRDRRVGDPLGRSHRPISGASSSRPTGPATAPPMPGSSTRCGRPSTVGSSWWPRRSAGRGASMAGRYATGAALLSTGAISGSDLTFEAALTKLMVLADRLDPDELRATMQQDLAGELTP